ncbi:beta-ketoacyl-ACP synthase [Thalassotalea litorea]|uniref:beta-ketoacyl-ACP synthase n=1 Tax=Thalassotalea litorea TaxID=2020715 RepID=UPI0037358727
MNVYLNDLGIICSLGNGKQQVTEALISPKNQEYLVCTDNFSIDDNQFYVGEVAFELPQLDSTENVQQSRNNQLALAAFQQIEASYKALSIHTDPKKVAVVIGTSTSGIKEGELAVEQYSKTKQFPDGFDYKVQEMNAPAEFLAQYIEAQGPAYSISTACSSSAKALASARALITSGTAEIVICGGVDTLSRLPINGFHALESTAANKCNPFSEQRDGINIGEAAALFVMSAQKSSILLAGTGESSDAYHISAPEPDGRGAIKAMEQALEEAGLGTDDIDYVNLHGTGTTKNDSMEANAIYHLFQDKVPCSSTKRLTGHTLGAAGALEAGLLFLLLGDGNQEDRLPENRSDFPIDKQIRGIRLSDGLPASKLCYALSNSFAFGGNNTSVILGKAGD